MSESKFQSVFDTAVDLEKDFDIMFGAEEDDKLIEAVLGFNEDGNPIPAADALHYKEVENADKKDLEDTLGPDNDSKNKPTEDSSDEFDIEDDGLDLADPESGVQDAVEKKELDNTDIEDEIEKSEHKSGIDEAYNSALADLLREADEEDPDTEEGASDATEDDESVKEAEDMGLDDDDLGVDNELGVDEDDEPLQEVSFSFLPRFKEKKEFKDLYKELSEAEKLLRYNGKPSNTQINKICGVALRVFDIIQNVGSAITIPICITIIGIPLYLLERAWEWIFQYGKEYNLKAQCEKAIAKLEKLKKETDNKKVKEKCTAEIAKLNKMIDKYDEKVNESSVLEAAEEGSAVADIEKMPEEESETDKEDKDGEEKSDGEEKHCVDDLESECDESDDEDEDDEDEKKVEKEVDEAYDELVSDLNVLFEEAETEESETGDDHPEEEKIEDDAIEEANSDETMSDEEVKDIEDVEDDDILDGMI